MSMARFKHYEKWTNLSQRKILGHAENFFQSKNMLYPINEMAAVQDLG